MFDINDIVKQILSDLAFEPVHTVKPQKTTAETTVKAVVDEVYDGVYIDSRVVSLAEINERLGNARKLFIAPKSILTPSAKDEIRKRKIEVAVKLSQSTDLVCKTIWLALHERTIISPNLLNRLQKDYILKQNSFETLPELLDEAERRLSDENTHENISGAVLTKQSATAMRLASRRDSLIPILGIDSKQAAEDKRELSANLLIVHPQRIGETKIYEIIRSFSNATMRIIHATF